MHDSATLLLQCFIRPHMSEFKNDRGHVRRVSQVFHAALRLTYEHYRWVR